MTRYGLWVERGGVGHWHSCYGQGESVCLFDDEAGPRELLRNGYDNTMRYSSRPYDPTITGLPSAHMGHFHGMPVDLEKIDANVKQIGTDGTRRAFNPSIVERHGELHVVIRYLERSVTTNHLARLSLDGRLSDVREIEEHIEDRNKRRRFEDVRLFVRRGQFWGTATILAPRPRVCVLEVSDNGRAVIHVQESPRDEKNWMPFVDGGKLKLVYAIDPIPTVLFFDDETKRVAPRIDDVPSTVHLFRGGSQIVEWDDGYLAVIHHLNLDEHRYPVYLHRFIKCDRSMTRFEKSRPFYFHSRGIEFVAGAVAQRDRLLLSFGLADQTSHLAVVRRDEVARLFLAR